MQFMFVKWYRPLRPSLGGNFIYWNYIGKHPNFLMWSFPNANAPSPLRGRLAFKPALSE